jgi:hypothetical protein
MAVMSMQDVMCSSSAYGGVLLAFIGNGDGSFTFGGTSVYSRGLAPQPSLIASHNFTRVYAAAGGGQVVGYSVASADGAATLIDGWGTLGDTGVMTFDASGDWLLLAASGTVIETHRVDQATGVIGPVEHAVYANTRNGVAASSLAMSQDNTNLVIVSPRTNTLISFSFSTASGDLSNRQDFPTDGILPQGVIVAELGIPGFDTGYIVTNAGSNTLSVFSGSPGGPLGLGSTIPLGDGAAVFCSGPSPIAAADLDSDGDVDLVVGCQGEAGDEQHHLIVLLNDGTANFSVFQL